MNKPKILLYDLETAPLKVYTWGIWEQNAIEVIESWQILSVAYKWLGDKDVHCFSKKGQKSDKEVTKKLWNLFNEADIIVAHNGNQFDNKKSKAKFIEHGLTPPKPYLLVDTKVVCKSNFAFTSNSLNEVAKLLGIGTKADTGGFKTWKGCMADDPKSWKTMIEYNKKDVLLLEKVYKRLLPWIKNHPDVSIPSFVQCPKCGSFNLQKRGYDNSKVKTYRRYCCNDCGGWARARLALKHSPKRKLVSL